jgi:hypothetical protein
VGNVGIAHKVGKVSTVMVYRLYTVRLYSTYNFYTVK